MRASIEIIEQEFGYKKSLVSLMIPSCAKPEKLGFFLYHQLKRLQFKSETIVSGVRRYHDCGELVVDIICNLKEEFFFPSVITPSQRSLANLLYKIIINNDEKVVSITIDKAEQKNQKRIVSVADFKDDNSNQFYSWLKAGELNR